MHSVLLCYYTGRKCKFYEPGNQNCKDNSANGFSPSAQYPQLFFSTMALVYLAASADYTGFYPWTAPPFTRCAATGDHVSSNPGYNPVRARVSIFSA
jgi:hypothetical protein